MQLNGSQIIIECLLEQGVDTVFGYPGGTILNVYDELYRYQDRIHHILTSHEQGASHAADGYARATGKTGVCMATSGPGATNLVTGIATAYMDSTPMVAITCNVGKALLGKDSFQEIDIAGVVMPITKHSFIVKNVEDLAPTIRRAFRIAKSGRPGPVLVDITKDVTAAETEYTYEEPAVIERKTDTIREEDINKVIEMIKVSDDFTLMIDYAHNAMALESLLTTLREYEPHRLISLFGCGGNRSRQRRFEMGEASGKLAGLTIITSDNPRFEEPQDIIDDIKTGMAKTDGNYVEICDRKEAITYAIEHGEPGDIIVLAGKGHEDYQEIRGVKHPMDERDLIRDILAEGHIPGSAAK